MGELEDKLNSILGDPAQMEKIAGLAKSLMGGGAAPRRTARPRPRLGSWGSIRDCCKSWAAR